VIFLTTKLPPRLAGKAHRTLEESLRSLGTDHVDLWLIHWPPGGADASAALWNTRSGSAAESTVTALRSRICDVRAAAAARITAGAAS
jgi:diketogulonate reductase-like aldo/keto reductase